MKRLDKTVSKSCNNSKIGAPSKIVLSQGPNKNQI